MRNASHWTWSNHRPLLSVSINYLMQVLPSIWRFSAVFWSAIFKTARPFLHNILQVHIFYNSLATVHKKIECLHFCFFKIKKHQIAAPTHLTMLSWILDLQLPYYYCAHFYFISDLQIVVAFEYLKRALRWELLAISSLQNSQKRVFLLVGAAFSICVK